MKIRATVTVLSVVMIFAACVPPAIDTARADNFALVFQDTPCGPTPMNTLDTSSGLLVHTPLTETTSITISLRLSDDELELVHQKAIAIDFFDYPSNFVIPDDQIIGGEVPYSSYQLSIINGKMTNSVTWVDRAITKPGYTKADELRELIYLIKDIIQAHPEIQELPEPTVGCA